MISDTGETTEINYSSYAGHVFDSGFERYRDTSVHFRANALRAAPAPAAQEQAELFPYFEADNDFGLMAKHAVAWRGVVSEALSESAVFSLAHVLEAGNDLDCSVLLASSLYYRQALQVLRNFLDDVVLGLHFCDNQKDFAKWNQGSFRTPPFRGHDGVLSRLASRELLSQDLTEVAGTLYKELNGSIHGAEHHLINRGVFRGEWAGLIFKDERFVEWCDYFSKCVDLGIRVLRLTVNHWLKIHPADRIQCDTCHGETFDVQTKVFANQPTVTLACKICNSSMTLTSERAAELGYG